ncbi:MAG TPA: tetraacyldisaccharide 4'-kinase [Myxococcota bacterium]|nr:tetraacyldisaccharide 4'-kinase [Myxococcota bacterium]
MLSAASWLGGAHARLRASLYAHGLLRARRLPVRALSVGTLHTAADPIATAWVARALERRGRRVAVATRVGRGLARGREEPVVVSDGRFLESRAEVAGAAAMVLAAHAPRVPVLAGRDLQRAALRAVSAFGAEIVVLDDAFQQLSLARDCDVVVLDALGGIGGAGRPRAARLREPLGALRRAGACLLIDGPLAESDAPRFARAREPVRLFAARRRPTALRALRGRAPEPPEALEGAVVGLISELAEPAALRRCVEQLGARVVTQRSFRDHRRYGQRDMQYLYRNAPLWLASEIDAVRINPAWIGRADVRVLSIELEVAQPAELLDWIEERLA